MFHKKLVFRIRQAIMKKIATKDNCTPSHPPTTYLWKTGNGKVAKDHFLVAGWNVNGIRSIIRKKKLAPFLL